MAGPLAEAILGTHYSAGFIGGVRVYQNVIDGWGFNWPISAHFEM
jgi:hypothetical protein